MGLHCQVYGCKTAVPRRLFVCKQHWQQLPKPLQNAIYRECKPGQGTYKSASTRFLAVQHHALAVLAKAKHSQGEGLPSNEVLRVVSGHFLNSWRLRLAAIHCGEGDPLPEEPLPETTVGLALFEES